MQEEVIESRLSAAERKLALMQSIIENLKNEVWGDSEFRSKRARMGARARWAGHRKKPKKREKPADVFANVDPFAGAP